MPQFWEQDAVVAPATQSRGAPRPILTVPDTDKQVDNARADAQLGLSQAGEARAGRQEQDSNLKDSIQNASTLQTRYETLAPVKEYRTMLPQFMQGLQTAPDATGDQTLLYAYAKIMDPGSVVRESEQGAAANGAGYWDAAVANVKKQFHIEGGGALSPDIRDHLKRDMLQRVQFAGKMYRQQRDRFTSDSQAYGIDPARVVGPDDFAPYEQDFAAWKQKQQQAQGGAGGVRDPEMAGGLPKGTDIQFGMDGVEEPFDHDRWLKQTYGMTPDQEPLVTAFWNQNSGNPRLTVDAAKAWYASKGLPAPDDGSLADGVARARAGQQFGGFDDSAAREEYTKQLRAANEREGFDPTSGGAYAARAVRGAEFGLTDEIQGVGGAVDALVNNRGVADGYRLARDQSRQAYSDMEGQQGALGTAAELAGGLVGGGIGASRAPMTAARAAGEGAAAGALAGFGYGEGTRDSVIGAATGAAVGGGLGYGVGRGVEALAARRASQPASEAAQSYAQGQKYGLDLSLGDVGGRGSKMVERSLDAQPASASTMNGPRRALAGQMEQAADTVAGEFGPATSFRGMGEAAQKGANRWVDKFNATVGKAYDAIPIKPDADSTLTSTRQVLGDLAGGYRSNSAMAEIMRNPRFTRYLDALTPQDTRQAGQVRFTQASDAVRSAENALARARQEASTNLGFEQSQARDAAEAARRSYDDLLGQARKEAVEAQKAFDGLRGQRGLAPQVEEAEQVATAASERFNALATRNRDIPEVAQALKGIDEAEAAFTSQRFREPSSDAVAAAEKKVAAAREAQDQAYVESRQPPMGGKLAWADLKNFRSMIGEEVGQAMLSDGTSKIQLRSLYAGLSKDMEATAAAQGPQALAKFKRANDLFAAGQQRIEGAITSLVGKDAQGKPEAAAAFLQRIARDGRGSADLAALANVRKTLRPDEWAQVSNSFVRLLGQPANSAGREFNPQTFIRAYTDMEPAAKNLLFSGEGKELRKNLDDFAEVIGRVAQNDSTRNTSATAFGLGSAMTTGSGAMLGNVIPIIGPLIGAAGAHAGVGLTAKIWTNPRFVRWATGYTKMAERAARGGGIDEAAFGKQMSALSRIAANDNVIAQEAAGLQASLREALAGPLKSAAAPPGPASKTPQERAPEAPR